MPNDRLKERPRSACDLMVNGALTAVSLSPALYALTIGRTHYRGPGHLVTIGEHAYFLPDDLNVLGRCGDADTGGVGLRTRMLLRFVPHHLRDIHRLLVDRGRD